MPIEPLGISIESQSEIELGHTIYDLMLELDSSDDQVGACHLQTLNAAHRLARAFWMAGDIQRATNLLDQILDHVSSSLGSAHPLRADVLVTLRNILFEEGLLEPAHVIQREILDWHAHHSGDCHPESIQARGHLAAILYELGRDEEADWIEREAHASARTHLSKFHPVASGLAWNRALHCERRGDGQSARNILSGELVWLLAEEPATLHPFQRMIQDLIAERLHWKTAPEC